MSAPWRRRAALAGGTLLLAAALGTFFAPALLTSKQFLYRDNGRMHWPVKRYFAERFARGEVPQWNPYLGLGAPVIAGAVDAVQHPFNLLLAALPFALAFKLWVLLSYLVAATGGAFWARSLDRGPHAALAAGLAFALSGFLVSASDNVTFLTTLAFVPWLLAAGHLWVERGGPGRLAILAAASALVAAGGDPQGWGVATLLLPLQALLFSERPRREALRRGLLAAASACAGAAPFILPVAAWIPHSSRTVPLTDRERLSWSLLPWRLGELAVPHLLRHPQGAFDSPLYRAYAHDPAAGIPWAQSIYVGVTVVALAVLGAARSRRAGLLLAGALLLGWASMGDRAGFGQIAGHLPVLGHFRYWEKLAVWPVLLISLGAAFGLDELVGRRGAARRFALGSAAAGGILLALLGLIHLFPGAARSAVAPSPGANGAAGLLLDNLSDGLQHGATLILLLALVALAVHRDRIRRAGAVALAVVLVDLFGANVRGYVLSPPELVRPRSPFGEHLASHTGLERIITPFGSASVQRPGLTQHEGVWLWSAQTLDPCFNVSHRVGNFKGYGGLVPGRAIRVAQRMGDQVMPVASLWDVGWVVVPGGLGNAARCGLSPPYDVAAVEPALPAWLLRVPHRARVYLAGRIAPTDAAHALEATLALDPAGDDTLLEGTVPAGYDPPKGEARIVRDAPEEVVVEVRSDRPALLVLNDTYAPGWSAAVDRRPAEILAANYLVRGVWVEAGAHTVAFRYHTPGLREGWATFGLGGLALVAWALARRRRARAPEIGRDAG